MWKFPDSFLDLSDPLNLQASFGVGSLFGLYKRRVHKLKTSFDYIGRYTVKFVLPENDRILNAAPISQN